VQEAEQQEEKEAAAARGDSDAAASGGGGRRKSRRHSRVSAPRHRADSESLASSSSESEDEDEAEAGADLAPSPVLRRSFVDSGGDTGSTRSSFAKRNLGTLIMKRRTTNIAAAGGTELAIQLSIAILPHGSHNMPMSVELLEPFFGENINSTCQNLEMIMEGDESLEVQGTRYWREQLSQLEAAVSKVKEDIHVSLEEKRNFFSFILTVVTVFLAPLTILTGYWGMNFDNMIELEAQTYEVLPGVKLLWFVATWVYLLFLALSVHFRVLYSAT
jgi:hypothetical protein